MSTRSPSKGQIAGPNPVRDPEARAGAAGDPREPPSILELQGLDKELWRDVDGASYVAEERATWR